MVFRSCAGGVSGIESTVKYFELLHVFCLMKKMVNGNHNPNHVSLAQTLLEVEENTDDQPAII